MSGEEIIIKRGIQFSAIIYQVVLNYWKGSCATPTGYRVVSEIAAKKFPSLGMIFESVAEIILAFRGSEDVIDFMNDFDALQTPYPFARHAGVVPRGFLHVYHAIRTGIWSGLSRLSKDKPLFIIGHSLGGALANLCALDLAVNSPFTQPHVMTFACPRIGNRDFVSTFNQTIYDSIGIVNIHDVVPHLPPHFLQVKGRFPISFQKGSAIRNHLIVNYFHALCHQAPFIAKLICEQNPTGFCPARTTKRKHITV